MTDKIDWSKVPKEEREHIRIGLRMLSSHIVHMGVYKAYNKKLVDDMIYEITKAEAGDGR